MDQAQYFLFAGLAITPSSEDELKANLAMQLG